MADLDDIIDTLIAEGYAEGPEGMRRIAETIINRSAVRGLTPGQVVRQPHQYTGYEHPGSKARKAQKSPKARTAAEAAWELALQPGDPTGGADHYLNPKKANPSWASKLPSTGSYGNHKFFASRPIPPGELPSVATLTDTVPPLPPAPVTPSIDMAQMRSRPPTNLIGDSFAQLPRPSGSNLADSLALSPIPGGRQTAQPFDAAFDTRSGAMRMLAQPETVSSQGLGIGRSRAPVALPRPRPQTAPPDLVSRSMQNIASANPTRLPPIAPSRSSVPSPVAQSVDLRQSRLPLPSGIGQPSRVTVSTAYTTPQSQIERGAPRVAQSPIGQPPATRTVASIPMPALRPTIPQSFAGQEGGAPRMTAAIPGPNNPTVKGQERLAASSPFPPANYGGVTNVALPPMPRPTIARAPVPMPPYRAVGDALDVRPTPALPRPRPNLGMGGVDVSAPIAQTGKVAPVPMPRLDRPGIFGKPQIFGRDIPLPGIIGVIQNVTKAMNNASGPFNNGADNLIYNTLRGGDFNTPGAATVQSGGYLFAPKQGGGYINVGRVNRGISAADDYAQRNANNSRPTNSYERMKASEGRGGGALSVMES